MSCGQPSGDSAGDQVRDDVKEYYGKTVLTTTDLKTSVCATPASGVKKHVSAVMKLIHDEVVSKYFGCGLVVPELLEGMKILDLGSGSGRDCYALSKLIGEDGFVTGVDMTDEMLETANKYIDYHRDKFGFKKSNVKFVKGYIENLKDAGIADNSVDIIISNCVINLCKDKKSVLQEAFRVLNDGGELFFSDIYADRIVSDEIRNNKVLWGEGMGGALYWKLLMSIAKEVGFEVPRVMNAKPVQILNPDLKKIVGDARFVSAEYRLFKLPSDAKREAAEVTYMGGIVGCEKEMQFDNSVKFIEGSPVIVDGDTAAILRCSRFKDKFQIKESKGDVKYPVKVGEIDPFQLAASN